MLRTNQDGNEARNAQSGSSVVRIKDTVFLCLSHWKWFVLSLLITVGAAVYYLKVTPKVYTRTASILLKPDEKKSASDEVFKDLGLNQNNFNLTNEILALKSNNVIQKVVERLNLEVEYYRDGAFHKEVAYGIDRPLEVVFEKMADDETASLTVKLRKDGSVEISDMTANGAEMDGRLTMKLGESVKTPLGNLRVTATPYYKEGMTADLSVERQAKASVVSSVIEKLSVILRDKNSTIIDIHFRDNSTARGDDVLNTLIAIYNENWVRDRNQRMVSTNEFIRERLGVIEQELGNVEQDIASYKSSHLMIDVDQVGGMAVAKANMAEEKQNELNNELYMLRYIRTYLTDGRHDDQLLPYSGGLTNSNITSQIAEYNQVMQQRNTHLANSSAQNPLVKDLDQHLSTLRRTMIQTLDNEQVLLDTKLGSVRSTRSQAVAKIASNPGQAKYLLSVERQQKVKESLYLFLLQRREENELSQAFAAYNTQLLEAPHGNKEPTEPVSRNILLLALGLGLIIPGGVIFAKESMNTTVRGRKDLDELKVPFVGEIPMAMAQDRKGLLRRKRGGADGQPSLIVREDSRNVMNEAFRVVRTNLEFILGFDNGHNVIMLTSMNPGSGKTFLSANLATSLAIKGKKVLAVDLDMRKGSLSEYVGDPEHGVSNYLSGQEADYRNLIVRMGQVDVLPCGTLPPNPTELLFSPRFTRMMDEVKAEYDYVFVDCSPVEIVADAAIIGRYADMTLFVVCAHLLDRGFLSDIEQWYEEKKYRNLSIILNGTTDAFSHYGYHRYGYRYGYHYGNYGYGEQGKTKRHRRSRRSVAVSADK